MRARVILAVLAALSLSACAAIQGNLSRAGAEVCKNADIVRVGWATVLANADFVADPFVRQAMIEGAKAALMSLDKCPP